MACICKTCEPIFFFSSQWHSIETFLPHKICCLFPVKHSTPRISIPSILWETEKPPSQDPAWAQAFFESIGLKWSTADKVGLPTFAIHLGLFALDISIASCWMACLFSISLFDPGGALLSRYFSDSEGLYENTRRFQNWNTFLQFHGTAFKLTIFALITLAISKNRLLWAFSWRNLDQSLCRHKTLLVLKRKL